MVAIVFRHAGEPPREVQIRPGESVMLGARRAGIDGIEGTCGGEAQCATCLVQVDPDWIERLPPAGSIECAVMEMNEHHGPRSRLACQIAVTRALEGLQLDVP